MSETFPGFVMASAVAAGRAGAELEVTPSGLLARTRADGDFVIPWSDAEFERGGASGRMIFVRSRRTDVILGSEAPGFAESILAGAELPARERLRAAIEADRGRLATRRVGIARIAAIGVVLLVALVFGLKYATRFVASAVPRSVDAAIGKAYFSSIEGSLAIVHRAPVDEAFKTILARFAAHTDLEGFEVEIDLVDSSTINAMALPGGRILVYRGLLEILGDENELAGVLAHELSHVTQRHHLTAIGRSLGLIAAVQFFVGDVAGLVAVGVEVMRRLTENGYSRDQESDADRQGVALLERSGIDPLALERALEKMAKAAGSTPEALKWLSTHPADEARRAAIREAAEQESGGRRMRFEPLGIDWNRVKQSL